MPWFREVDELEHRDECFGRRFQSRIFADVQPTSIGCEYISNARTPEENVGRQKSSKDSQACGRKRRPYSTLANRGP
jgi:hypothetical protein